MASCVFPGSPGPCVHDQDQADFMKTETQGEGNYASTAFSDADPETVQGLTLPPNSQSNDQWLLDDTTAAFEEQDLDAILGSLEFDPLEDGEQADNSAIQVMINDQYLQMEPPTKRRKLTSEPSSANIAAANSSPNQTLARTNDLAQTTESQTPAQLSYPVLSIETRVPARMNDLAQSTESHTPTPAQVNDLARSTKSHSLPTDSGYLSTVSVLDDDEGSDSHEGGDEFDDDGSLFGDASSIRGGSVDCPQAADTASFSLPLPSVKGTETPLLRSRWPQLPLPSVERSETSIPNSWWPQLPLPSVDRTETMAAPLRVPASATPTTVSSGPDVPLPSVESRAPHQFFHKFQVTLGKQHVPWSREATASMVDGGDVLGEINRVLKSPPRKEYPVRMSEQDRIPPRESSTSSSGPPSLPILVALSLATPDSLQSVVDTILSASKSPNDILRSGATTPACPVPAELDQLLNALHQKFNSEPAFRSGVLTWAVNKIGP